jgi:hypothetical protein
MILILIMLFCPDVAASQDQEHDQEQEREPFGTAID